MKIICILLTVVLLSIAINLSSVFGKSSNENNRILTSPPSIKSDTTIDIKGILIDVLVPPGELKADLLILPGWNFDRKEWCKNSDLCQKALNKGYRLILPEMAKSIYATHYFKETRKDWLKYPTLSWVTDTMIPFLQKEYGILLENKRNFIIGLSTGGRGVVLVSNKLPLIFKGAAALSGDYDPTQVRTDNLIRGVYGEYEQFKKRWESLDNPTQQINKVQIPLYLGHGLDDKVINPLQTINFYNQLHKAKPGLKVLLHTPEKKGP